MTECPKCGGTDIAMIFWGLPQMSKDLEKKVKDKKYFKLEELIKRIEAKYNVSGCPFMIAITAFYIERIKNKTLLEAAEIQDFNIEKTLELPINKKDRLFLLEDALKNCIKQINRGK